MYKLLVDYWISYRQIKFSCLALFKTSISFLSIESGLLNAFLSKAPKGITYLKKIY